MLFQTVKIARNYTKLNFAKTRLDVQWCTLSVWRPRKPYQKLVCCDMPKANITFATLHFFILSSIKCVLSPKCFSTKCRRCDVSNGLLVSVCRKHRFKGNYTIASYYTGIWCKTNETFLMSIRNTVVSVDTEFFYGICVCFASTCFWCRFQSKLRD